MYAMNLARYKFCPEIKEKGLSGLPRLVLFTSEEVKAKQKSFLNFTFQWLQNYIICISDGALVQYICLLCMMWNVGAKWRSLIVNFPAEASVLSENKHRCSCSWKVLIQEQVLCGANLKQNACGLLWTSAALFISHIMGSPAGAIGRFWMSKLFSAGLICTKLSTCGPVSWLSAAPTLPYVCIQIGCGTEPNHP